MAALGPQKGHREKLQFVELFLSVQCRLQILWRALLSLTPVTPEMLTDEQQLPMQSVGDRNMGLTNSDGMFCLVTEKRLVKSSPELQAHNQGLQTKRLSVL